jgi:chromosomal replication initiation ATPase DnaA
VGGWYHITARGNERRAFYRDNRNRHADTGRDLVLYLGRKVCGLKLNDLAALAGMKEYATVAMAVKRFETRLNKQSVLQEECRRVKQLLNVKM